jgi:hypothetical protein
MAAGQITYRKFRDRAELRARGHCSPSSSACYYRQWGVETHELFERHELVHAYVAHWGDSHRLLEEGLASALSCGPHLPQKVDFGVKFAFSHNAWLSEDKASVQRLYAAGARFVAHVIRTYGPERFRAFYSRTTSGSQYVDAAKAFGDVFAADLEVEWRKANESHVVDSGCLYAYECSLDALEGRSRTEGNKQGTITVNEGELLHIATKEPYRFRMAACAEHTVLPYESERSRATGGVGGNEHWLGLTPGKYWLEHAQSVWERQSTANRLVAANECERVNWVNVERSSDVFVALSADTIGAVLARANHAGARAEAMVFAVRTGFTSPRPVILECSDTARVEVCTACDYMQCQLACGAQPTLPLKLSERAVFKVTADPAAKLWFRLRLGRR